MARNITLTLGAGLGADLGPNFNLTANVGSVTPSTATKTELTAGKSVSVDDAATQVTVTSTGTCTNAITQTIPCAGGTTTTTTTAAPTTTTTTTTVAPTTTTTTAAAPTTANINIATNGSLDISMNIDNITVNGVGPVSYTGVTPNTTGNGGNVITNQLGTYDIVVTYTATTGGQHIELVDSNGTTYCNNTSLGFNSMTFSSVVVNGTTDLILTALDGTC
jgi:hypothetical protein